MSKELLQKANLLSEKIEQNLYNKRVLPEFRNKSYKYGYLSFSTFGESSKQAKIVVENDDFDSVLFLLDKLNEAKLLEHQAEFDSIFKK